jgi:hypothetical protein
MSHQNPREERWIAYHLGELSPAERREVEAELKASPHAAADYERLIQGIARWATEPVPYTPLRIENLGIEELKAGAKASGRVIEGWRRLIRPKSWVWGFAAAAACLLIFMQAEFSFRLGKVNLEWGAPAADPETAQLRDQVDRLTAQLAGMSESIQTQDKLIRDVAYTSSLQDALLESQLDSATSQLVRFVQSESQTRYQDFQNFLQLAGLNSTTPEWMTEASLGSPNQSAAPPQTGQENN